MKLLTLTLLSAILCLAATAQEKVTLRLVDWASAGELQSDLQALDEFRKAAPGIEVLYEPNPERMYEEKILTGLAAGAPPDVFLLDSKLIPTFLGKGILLDLSPFLPALSVDTAAWYPNVLNIARRGPALYALPKGFTPMVVYYNKALFRAARLPFPRDTWDRNEFLDDARALTRDTDGDGAIDQYGTAFTNYYYNWIPWVWSAGGDVLSPDGMRSSGYLNSPATEAALQFLIDLRVKERVAPDLGSWVQAEKTGTNEALFANGKIGMIVDGHWRMPQFARYVEAGKLDVGVAPFPRAPGGGKVNVMYESGWCVPVNSPHQKEAVLLASFMAGETACRVRAGNRLEIPSQRRVAEEFVRKDTTGLEAVFLSEVASCRQPWGSLVERFSEIEWTLQDAVDEVMLNQAPLHATMTRYASKVDAELAGIRANSATTFTRLGDQPEVLTFLIGVALFVGCGCAVFYVRAKRARRTAATALGFLAPSLLHVCVFVFTPIAFAAWLGAHRWDIIAPSKPFVGAANFAEILQDELFWNALKNTLVFTLNVPVGMAAALALALALNRRMKGRGLMRTLYFLPGVTSVVAVALVWMWIYHPTFGLANYLLAMAGIPPLQWLNSTSTSMISVMIFTIWLGLGYQMMIFLAGLQSIPEELYDAARIDGATGWRKFTRITLPLLRPTTFFILVTSFIGSFQVFTSVYVMTAGGPVRSTDVIVYHIYQAAWEQLRMGYASALSWVLFVIIMGATWLQFRFLGREVEY